LLPSKPIKAAGCAPLLPGDIENYDAIIFGAASFNGQVYVIETDENQAATPLLTLCSCLMTI
jgi:hypothetical protein